MKITTALTTLRRSPRIRTKKGREVVPAPPVIAINPASAKMCVDELADLVVTMAIEASPPLPSEDQPPTPKSIIRRARSSIANATAGKKRVRFHREASAIEAEAEAEADAREEAAATREEEELLTEILCLLKPSSEMTPEEKSDVWWEERDFAQFQGTARLIGAEIRRRTEAAGGESPSPGRAPGYAQVLAHALESCRRAAAADEDDDSASSPRSRCREDEAFENPLSKMVLAYLTHWSAMGHSRRGLEKWSVDSRRAHFQSYRDDTVRAVLEAQRSQTCAAAASRRNSRGARMFALAMGTADAAAAEHKPPPPCSLFAAEDDEIRVSRRHACSSRASRKKVVSAAA